VHPQNICPLVKATVFKTVVPFKASFAVEFSSLYIIDFLDIPINSGSSKLLNNSALRSTS
jgi:hypothetical protein